MNQPQEQTPIDWKNKYHLLHKEMVQLRDELRFATILIALLLLLGFWGFWQQPSPSREAGFRPRRQVERGHSPSTPSLQRLESPPSPISPAPILRSPSARVPAAPSFTTDWRFRDLPDQQPNPRRPWVKRIPRRLTVQKTTRVPNPQKTSLRKYPRFGDPIPSHLAPSHWCQPGFVYGFYRLCLQRNEKRRCIRRSEQRKYTCIPLSWKQKHGTKPNK